MPSFAEWSAREKRHGFRGSYAGYLDTLEAEKAEAAELLHFSEYEAN